MRSALRNTGVQAALASAVLFGAGTPVAKILLGEASPWLLAGLLYTGSGIGLTIIRRIRRAPWVRLTREDLAPLAGAITAGGIVAPVLLLFGLATMPASGASLLLNAESVFTAGLAWFVFKENFDRRIALGMLAIVAGAVLLSVPSGANLGSAWPVLSVLGACLCWGVDNNLTRKVALTDATWLAATKGLVAGATNLLLAFLLGTHLPSGGNAAAALIVGFFAYGVSLVLFIVAMRHVGTARAGAYYAVAPFFGSLLAIALGDHPTWATLAAAALMALGVWLHLTERHEHLHTHRPQVHAHWHTHDAHHQHAHDISTAAGTWHKHPHSHEQLTHTHEHYPDSHHQHTHRASSAN